MHPPPRLGDDDTAVRCVEHTVTPVRTGHGPSLGSIPADATAESRADQQPDASEHLIAGLADTVGAIVLVLDARGRVRGVNSCLRSDHGTSSRRPGGSADPGHARSPVQHDAAREALAVLDEAFHRALGISLTSYIAQRRLVEVRRRQGQGYATGAAAAALADAFGRTGCAEVLADAAGDNARSQAVMIKLGLTRRPSLDFSHHYDGFGSWRGLVWFATPLTGPFDEAVLSQRNAFPYTPAIASVPHPDGAARVRRA